LDQNAINIQNQGRSQLLDFGRAKLKKNKIEGPKLKKKKRVKINLFIYFFRFFYFFGKSLGLGGVMDLPSLHLAMPLSKTF
jgi:hypothetical protein